MIYCIYHPPLCRKQFPCCSVFSQFMISSYSFRLFLLIHNKNKPVTFYTALRIIVKYYSSTQLHATYLWRLFIPLGFDYSLIPPILTSHCAGLTGLSFWPIIALKFIVKSLVATFLYGLSIFTTFFDLCQPPIQDNFTFKIHYFTFNK